MGMIQAIGRGVVDYALPPRCPGCGIVTADDHRFCADCWQAIEFLGGTVCAGCAAALGEGEGACEACAGAPPPLDGIAAAVAYGPIARRLALRLKYGRRPGIARTMAAAMARLVPPGGETLLVPVPLHRWRLWSRGFNQAALIARAIAAETGAMLAVDLLRRTRATPRLRGLGAAARARTVRDAFAVADPAGVAGRRILLVDDVCTTGATARACAAALKQAGAREVRLVCWARVRLAGR